MSAERADVPLPDLPTRESEAREWIEAAVMLLVKDGVDVVLTGTGRFAMSTVPQTVNVTAPVRVVGDLDGLKWSADLSFDVGAQTEISGFEARTPEGFLFARGPLRQRERFPVRGTYTLQLEIDFYDFPLGPARSTT